MKISAAVFINVFKLLHSNYTVILNVTVLNENIEFIYVLFI